MAYNLMPVLQMAWIVLNGIDRSCSQASRQGGGGARGAHAPPPRSQKGPPDGIVKDLK